MGLGNLATVIIAALSAFASITGHAVTTHQPLPTTDTRPNVLVFMLDDMRWDDLAYAPNARKYVADRGLTFANAFAPFPLCCPSRASFMTGKYAHNHGVLYHEAPYAFGAMNDSFTIGTAMQNAGYQTALVGKYLNRYGVDPSLVTGQPSATYVPPGWTDWMAGLENGWAAPWRGQTYNYFNIAQNINGVPTSHPGTYSSTVIADETNRLIKKYSRTGKPFFMDVTPVAPHFGDPVEPDDPQPWYAPNGFVWKMQTPARPDWVKGRFDKTITHPPGFPRNHPAEADVSDKPAYIRRLPEPDRRAFRSDLEITRQRAEAIYATDREFGRIVKTLKRTGQFDNTVIVFTSDNGYNLGEHRVLEGKVKPHEPVLRFPLLIAGPGVHHGVRYTPITIPDLTATITQIGHAVLPDMDGKSLWPRITGPDGPWDQAVLTEGFFPGMIRRLPLMGALHERGIRTGRYKYVQYSTGGFEFYDLLNDPNELNNLHGDPRYRSLIRQARKLWLRYYNCREASCRVPLPQGWQVSDKQLAAIDAHMQAEKHRYYDSE